MYLHFQNEYLEYYSDRPKNDKKRQINKIKDVYRYSGLTCIPDGSV